MNSEVICISSKSTPNTWYIFRNNGVEVTIELVKNYFKSNKQLTDFEIEYLNKNLR